MISIAHGINLIYCCDDTVRSNKDSKLPLTEALLLWSEVRLDTMMGRPWHSEADSLKAADSLIADERGD